MKSSEFIVESTKTLSELSNSTMDSYATKASVKAKGLIDQANNQGYGDEGNATYGKAYKRLKGIEKANSKMKTQPSVAEASEGNVELPKTPRGMERTSHGRLVKKGPREPAQQQQSSVTAHGRPIKKEKKVEEASEGNVGIEAHGIRGMDRKPWQKTFKNHAQMMAWAEKYDADIQGTRDVEQARKGNLMPSMREDGDKPGEAGMNRPWGNRNPANKNKSFAEMAQIERDYAKRMRSVGQDSLASRSESIAAEYDALAKKSSTNEDATAGATSSGSIATAPAGSLFTPTKKKIIKRTAGK